LYAKGILAGKRSGFRIEEFDRLLNGDDDDALERLKTIVEKGEVSPRKPKGEDSKDCTHFDLFVKDHEEWAKENAHVVFRDRIDLKNKPHAQVERIQKSGLCYMHAGVVLQHYLVAMNSKDFVPMLNMAEYLKKYMSGDALYKHIWEDEGGNSINFFERILKDKPDPMDLNPHSSRKELNNLRLVSGFSVTKDFSNYTKKLWQHIGIDQDPTIVGQHAMVLVGYRSCGKKLRYLLQNWWEEKPYVEVDGDHLRRSKATVHFMTKPLLEMGEYPQNDEAFVECINGLDASDNFLPERY
jgi:hypothetical protein